MSCRTGAELHRIKAELQSPGGCDSCSCARGDVWEKLPSAKFGDTLLTRQYNSRVGCCFLSLLYFFFFFTAQWDLSLYFKCVSFKAVVKIPSYCLHCSSSSLTAADKHLTLSGPVLYMRHTAWSCGKTACSPLFEKGISQELCSYTANQSPSPLISGKLSVFFTHRAGKHVKNFPRQNFCQCKSVQLLWSLRTYCQEGQD